MMWRYLGNWGWLGMGVGMIVRIVLIALLIYAVTKIALRNRNENRPKNASHSIDILNERYAKGEIDDEEYQKRFNILNKK